MLIGKALQALDRLADVLAADRERHDLLYVGEAQAEACRANTIDTHFDIAATLDTLGVGRPGAGYFLDGRLDLLAESSRSPSDRVPRS